jgi:phosphoglycolate phosphatase-like HAD superfamily hydrolase
MRVQHRPQLCRRPSAVFLAFSMLAIVGCSQPVAPPTAADVDPLASWNDGENKSAIMGFVSRVTDPAGPDFVPEAERIAVFDNDGCLWSEQPMYFQLFFAIDRVKAMAFEHPEWATTQPFQAVLENDLDALLGSGEHGLIEIVMATHAGMTTAEFEAVVTDWIATARHPTTGRLFTDMVYQPMLEVLDYFRANGFKTFIVSGGGIEFMRPWTERTYGVPPEQVVGSSVTTQFEMVAGEPVLVRLPELHFIDDKAGKPVGINQHIGRRPIAAFGNSDGDLQMLQYSTFGNSPSLGVYIHHDDAEREWAYDRESHIGRLSEGLDQAPQRGWLVVSMNEDWRAIYPEEK